MSSSLTTGVQVVRQNGGNRRDFGRLWRGSGQSRWRAGKHEYPLRDPECNYMESGGKQRIVDGEVLAPDAPGMSSEVTPDFIAKHKIS